MGMKKRTQPIREAFNYKIGSWKRVSWPWRTAKIKRKRPLKVRKDRLQL